MTDILHDFPIKASAAKVFAAVSTPAGLDEWWTRGSTGEPRVGAEYELFFGEPYRWRATVTACVPGEHIAFTIRDSDPDWAGTTISIRLREADGKTHVQFAHTGWPEPNAHYRTSNCCWAAYLRILRRYVEHGERVPYAQRLDV